jgi:hypothetical protein
MFPGHRRLKDGPRPLQATQFEADIRIAEQLLDVFFDRAAAAEDGGESYCLSWYFADMHNGHRLLQ